MKLLAQIFLIILIVLGFYWLIWQAWMFVVPVFCYACPESWTHPDYWVFVVGLFLLGIISKIIFNRDNK